MPKNTNKIDFKNSLTTTLPLREREWDARRAQETNFPLPFFYYSSVIKAHELWDGGEGRKGGEGDWNLTLMPLRVYITCKLFYFSLP